MKTRGFTLIELLAVIVILAVIALIVTPIILGIISDSKKSAFQASAYGISQSAKNLFIEKMYAGEDPKDILFTYNNGVESSNPSGYTLRYGGNKPKNGQISLTSEGKVSLAIHDGTWCVTKGYNDAQTTITDKAWEDCNLPSAQIVDSSGANAPVLVQGMRAVIWDQNSNQWIDASNINDSYKQNWYDYGEKKWANVMTNDGSMWVWIPRYVYKISSGWHSNTTGTINIQFSQGTNDNWNSNITLNMGAGANSSNNTWTNHPGFTFGTTELPGIWVAKFEATAAEGVANIYIPDGSCPTVGDNVTTKTIKVIPNVSSWRCINVGNVFTTIRNMETKSVYGWPTATSLQTNGTFLTDNNGIDTHMMKNVEWGAIAYLSKSQYGKDNEEIYVNNSQKFITGCTGNTVSSGVYDGCQNAYHTTAGVKASTTGNIYGIYDISGGSWERISAYINNGSSNLAGLGASIINSVNKYKEIYTLSGADNQANNYGLTVNFKGDAIWETSSSGSGSTSWFGDYSNMPYTNEPWLIRSADIYNGSNAGAFSFLNTGGDVFSYFGFRPIVVVGTGL